MTDSISIILRAADFAARKHMSQKRKGATAIPYINHPVKVALYLKEIGGVDDHDVIAAALLHDTVEDTDTEESDLEELFGKRIARIVMEVTDDKSLPKMRRKELQIEHAPHLSAEAKHIKLADKIANVEDMLVNPPADWSNERRFEYVEWGEHVVAGLDGTNIALETRFRAVAKEAKSVFEN
jgi:guanosine-3',5'-bis(diphosphate) 3'-pyrophosphohydrolase